MTDEVAGVREAAKTHQSLADVCLSFENGAECDFGSLSTTVRQSVNGHHTERSFANANIFSRSAKAVYQDFFALS